MKLKSETDTPDLDKAQAEGSQTVRSGKVKKNLVGRLRAKREIEVRKDVERRIEEAKAEEREACASIAEYYFDCSGRGVAAMIRARSNPNQALDKGTGGGSDT